MDKSSESFTELDKAPEDTAKIRQCLKCRNGFPSEWIGERVCPRCKKLNAWRYGRL
jgi:uncharacterized paraquat-inducible protein A